MICDTSLESLYGELVYIQNFSFVSDHSLGEITC